MVRQAHHHVRDDSLLLIIRVDTGMLRWYNPTLYRKPRTQRTSWKRHLLISLILKESARTVSGRKCAPRTGGTRSRDGVKKDGIVSRSNGVLMWLSLKIQDKPKSASPILGRAIRAELPASHEAPLLLVSVPKKIVRLAVHRNRLKRLIRESFRKQERLNLKKAYLFRVLQDPGDLGLKQAQEAMSRLLWN